MKHRGSTQILTNLVGVHPSNTYTKYEANPFNGSREEKTKKKFMTTTTTTTDTW